MARKTMAQDIAPVSGVPMTENQRVQEEILETLARLGSLRVQDDALVFEGSRFILPASMAGRVGDAVRYLEDWERSQQATYSYSRQYRYRPFDGAAAFDRAMKSVFGSGGIGKSTKSMFGENPPELVTVESGWGQTIQVPWGQVEFSPLDATFILDDSEHREWGNVFTLRVQAPKKYRAHIDAFFQVVEEELRENSIYRGKAITGASTPGFVNTGTVDPSKVIYSDRVMQQLDANIWSVIKYADTMREVKLPLKRQVLLYGPYGTGKTLAGLLTAQTAQANGWTYIQVRAGEDDLYAALKTAQIYAPCVVMFEDIDVIKTDKSDGVSKLLDMLDGVSNKGVEVVSVFTTNHPDRLHRGMMRPGRLDAVVELAGLDAGGVRRLIEATVPVHLLDPALDWDQVIEAFKDLLPAFAVEATGRAQRYAISRSGGIPQVITSQDLVGAAEGIRAQVKMMEEAPLASDKDNVGEALKGLVNGSIQEHKINLDGGPTYTQLVPVNRRN